MTDHPHPRRSEVAVHFLPSDRVQHAIDSLSILGLARRPESHLQTCNGVGTCWNACAGGGTCLSPDDVERRFLAE